MTGRPRWLPKELRYSDYGGDWEKFLTDVYEIFKQDFKISPPSYEGLPIKYDLRIETDKEMGFWHIIQRQDYTEKERVPDLRRCERMPWPKPMIENTKDNYISVWENTRKKPNRREQVRVLIWLEKFDYLVVLAKRPSEMILITAYCTDIKSQRKKIIKERDAYINAKAAP